MAKLRTVWSQTSAIFVRTIITLALCLRSISSDEMEAGVHGSGDSKVEKFLDYYNRESTKFQKTDTTAWWNYETDMTPENQKATLKITSQLTAFSKKTKKLAKKYLKEESDLPGDWKRQLKLIQHSASLADDADAKRLSGLISNMTSIYSETAIRVKKKSDGSIARLKLNKDILPLMSSVSKRNMKNLKLLWGLWHDKVGMKIKPLYEDYVELVNKGARENGFEDYGDYLRKGYEVGESLRGILQEAWQDVKPLYKKMHAYARFKLSLDFPDQVSKTGPIPSIFLNMWMQNWSHLYQSMTPFPASELPDVTSELKGKNMTKRAILELAESFFVSIGLEKMPKSFWTKSLFEKIEGKKAVCHPSSWDVGGGDVRLKMPCMGVSQQDLVTVHHEMGHVQYYLLYKDLPTEFRTGANPGFHEAVGDTVSLSVMIPKHLKSIGLLKSFEDSDEAELNFLMKQALQKIPFLPFGYLVDLWRWSVFSGRTSPNEYNKKWWDLRMEYQGVKSSMQRNESTFDAGCFFHIAHNTEYLRYFLSQLFQFQFHEGLCKEAGDNGPLHKCSIHKSKEAGKVFRKMLELGKSKPWKEALFVVTGSKELSAKPFLRYFKPLENWLDRHRKSNDYELGW